MNDDVADKVAAPLKAIGHELEQIKHILENIRASLAEAKKPKKLKK